jgi:hypothetical protein
MHAFDYCSKLVEVNIGSGLTNLDVNDSFDKCSALAAINVDAGNTAYASDGGVLFNKYKTTLLRCPMAKAGSYAIPASVSAVGANAFYGCTRLTSVVIPNSITDIGDNGNIYAINGNSFEVCTNLVSLTIGAGVKFIGVSSFLNCSKLEMVYFNAVNNSETMVNSASYPAFKGCGKLATLIIGDGVTQIPKYCFAQFTGLTSVTIPASVTSIGDYAFYACRSLTEMENRATTPQAVTASVFDYVDKVACTLRVPAASVAAYRAAEVWREFNIVAIGPAPSVTSVYSKVIDLRDFQ